MLFINIRSNLLPDIKLGQDDDISDNGSEGNDENDDPDYNGDNMEDFDEESNNGIQVYDLWKRLKIMKYRLIFMPMMIVEITPFTD